MSHEYVDPTREDDPHALPDVEVFHLSDADVMVRDLRDGDGEFMGAGWYYQYGMPGYMPDSDPSGPYDTEDEALAAAREDAGIEEDV